MTTERHKSPRLFSDLAIPPSEVLAEELEVRGMTQEELAARMDCSPQVIDEIVRAERAITPEIASALGTALGGSSQFWTNLEEHYRIELIVCHRQRHREESVGLQTLQVPRRLVGEVHADGRPLRPARQTPLRHLECCPACNALWGSTNPMTPSSFRYRSTLRAKNRPATSWWVG